MTSLCRIYFGPTLLAEGFFKGEQWWSSAMLCPKCGQLWGRVKREGAEWAAFHWPCPEHGDSRIGGSFFSELKWLGSSGCIETSEETAWTFIEGNGDLLKHEFNAHCDWAERKVRDAERLL